MHSMLGQALGSATINPIDMPTPDLGDTQAQFGATLGTVSNMETPAAKGKTPAMTATMNTVVERPGEEASEAMSMTQTKKLQSVASKSFVS